MKTNNMKKIVVSTLGLVMGAALVGSISGSVAWYQYSTRAAASMTATSAGTSRNLQIKHKADEDAAANWKNYLSESNQNLKPVTVGTTTAKNATSIAKFYSQPIYQYAQSGKDLGAAPSGYVLQYTYNFRVFDKTEAKTAGSAVADKLVYLQDMVIEAKDPTKPAAVALAKAIRVHVAGNNGSSAVGGIFAADVESTNLYGQLDLGGAAGADTMDADFSDSSTTKINYGLVDGAQTLASYSLAKEKGTAEGNHTFLVNDANPYALSGGIAVAKTTATVSNDVVITIWLEGWGMIGETPSATWDFATYINQQVKLDFRFVTQAE